jgi:hypothetical protein
MVLHALATDPERPLDLNRNARASGPAACRLDLLDPSRLALVAEAIAVYKGCRKDLARGVPRWDADQFALAIDCGEMA